MLGLGFFHVQPPNLAKEVHKKRHSFMYSAWTNEPKQNVPNAKGYKKGAKKSFKKGRNKRANVFWMLAETEEKVWMSDGGV